MSTKGYTELNLESSVPMAGRPKKYTAEKGANDRLSLVWWNVGDDGILDLSGASPKFVSAARNYIPGVGYILNKGPEYTKVAGEAPRTYIATIVARWPLDKRTFKPPTSIKELRDGVEIMPWIFASDKFETLKTKNRALPFNKNDILITCTDAKFQKMDITPQPGGVLNMLLGASAKGNAAAKEFLSELTAQVTALSEILVDQIGRDLTIEEIRQKQTGGGNSFSGGEGELSDALLSEDVDVTSVLDDVMGE